MSSVNPLIEIETHLEELELICDTLSVKVPDTEAIQDAKDIIKHVRITICSVRDHKLKQQYTLRLRKNEIRIEKAEKGLLFQRLEDRTEHNVQSTSRLNAALEQLHECETTASETLEHLTAQREVLEKTNENLKNTKSSLGTSGRFLDRMSAFWRG